MYATLLVYVAAVLGVSSAGQPPFPDFGPAFNGMEPMPKQFPFQSNMNFGGPNAFFDGKQSMSMPGNHGLYPYNPLYQEVRLIPNMPFGGPRGPFPAYDQFAPRPPMPMLPGGGMMADPFCDTGLPWQQTHQAYWGMGRTGNPYPAPSMPPHVGFNPEFKSETNKFNDWTNRELGFYDNNGQWVNQPADNTGRQFSDQFGGPSDKFMDNNNAWGPRDQSDRFFGQNEGGLRPFGGERTDNWGQGFNDRSAGFGNSNADWTNNQAVNSFGGPNTGLGQTFGQTNDVNLPKPLDEVVQTQPLVQEGFRPESRPLRRKRSTRLLQLLAS